MDRKRGQSYIKKYADEFDFVTSSSKSKYHAFCKICRRDISILHGGRNDIVIHSRSKQHITAFESESSSQKITSWIRMPTSQDLDVTRAECLFTAFYLEHNIPLSAASHMGPLLRKAFPNSEEVKKFSSARTKTSCLVREMAKDEQGQIISAMKTGPFAISTDGSNTSSSKLYPIVINYHDGKQISCSLLSLPTLEMEGTGENIAQLLIKELQKHDVPWENCTSLGSDNASVMIGVHKGVGAWLRKCQPNLIVLGCPNHLIDLAVKAASSALPYSVDSLLVDVFYYLEASVNRKLNLKKFQMLIGNEVHAILKHVCTRWLSLGQCLPRFLQQWQALVLFFEGEVSAQQKKPAQPSKTSVQTPKTKNATPAVKTKPALGSQLKKKPAQQTKIATQLQAFRIPKKVSTDSPPVSKPAHPQTQTQPQPSKRPAQQTKVATQFQPFHIPKKVSTCTDPPPVSKPAHPRTQTQPQPSKKPAQQTKIATQLQAFPIPKKVSTDPPPVSKPAQPQTQSKSQPQPSVSLPQHSTTSPSCTVGRKRQVKDTSDTPHKKQKTGKVSSKAASSKVLKAGTSSRPTKASSKTTGNEETSQKGKDESRPERILKSLHSKLRLAIAHFLSHSITAFDKKSVILQTRSPLIHKLKGILESLLRDLYSKFVTPQAILAATDLTLVDYKNKENLREESEIVIGSATREIVETLDASDRLTFYATVCSYYTKACDYIVSKFPLKSDVLIHAQVADIACGKDAKFTSLQFFITKFPCMLLQKEEEDKHSALDALENQFLNYQLAQLRDSVQNEESADKQWTSMVTQKNASGELCYDRLARVMLGILTIPHTNAECERVFSRVRKNKTDFRGSMSNETLESLLVTKARQTGPCYMREFGPTFLKKAKSATYKALNE